MDIYKVSIGPEFNNTKNKIFAIKNVIQILPGNFDSHEILASREHTKYVEISEIKQDEKNIYVAIDTYYHDAFSHWFFESFIFLEQLFVLQNTYPSFRVILLSNRKYKLDFLNRFDIQVVTSLPHENYVLFFPKITSLNQNKNLYDFESRLEKFWTFLQNLKPANNNLCSTLIIPRAKENNYANNDRHVDSSDIELGVSKMPGGVVFNPEANNTFILQHELVGYCKTLIVPDGSGFLVNGFLALNSQIIVLGAELVPIQALEYDKVAIILEKIKLHNDLIFIKSVSNNFYLNSIAPFLNSSYIGPQSIFRVRNNIF